MNTQLKELNSVEQGVIIKSYDELIQMVIQLNEFGYDETAKRTLELIEQKLIRDIFDYEILFKHYKDTKNVDAMFDAGDKLTKLNSLYITILLCIKSDNPMDIEYWLKNNLLDNQVVRK
jgi:hypothetical protein